MIIITGFKPYLTNKTNSSEVIVSNLDDIHAGSLNMKRRILPVTFRACREFAEQELKHCKALIMLGLKPSSDCIELERIAVNLEDSEHADESGDCATGRIIQIEGPAGYFSTLPMTSIFSQLYQKEIPVKFSNHAGTYVCNSLFYPAMHHLQGSCVPAGFIHLPPTSSDWTIQKLGKAVETIIEVVMAEGIETGVHHV